MTTWRGLVPEREFVFAREVLLPLLCREILGSFGLVRPRPDEGLLPRPVDDLEELPREEDFAVEREELLEAVFDLRAVLFFALVVDWRAMI